MRLPSVLSFAALAALALAGCAGEPGDDACDPSPCDDGVPVPAAVVAPAIEAGAVLDELYAFAADHPYRQSGTAMHAAARDTLEAGFAGAGLQTHRDAFTASVEAGAAPFEGQNIVGIKWGADRSRWIVVGAHYDVTEDAVHGCYDDGSGTMLVQHLARAYAGINTTRTVAFVEFDQEERGLVGAEAFLDHVEDGSLAAALELANVTVDGMVDLDMVGITWPHPAPLIVWENSPTLQGWVAELANATGMPADKLSFRESRSGSSDGAAFIGRGVATAYLWSNWDEVYLPTGQEVPFVLAYAGAYPFWHHADTCAGMEALAGGRATLEAGFQTVLDIVSPLVLRMSGPEFRPDGEY